MPRGKSTTVEVNGYAGREFRTIQGLDAEEIAKKMGVNRNYLYKIELGYNTRVSSTVFRAWQDALCVTDRRALLNNPHAQSKVNGGNGNGDEDAA